jgi:predicted DNA-binding protein (UPF0251 family)
MQDGALQILVVAAPLVLGLAFGVMAQKLFGIASSIVDVQSRLSQIAVSTGWTLGVGVVASAPGYLSGLLSALRDHSRGAFLIFCLTYLVGFGLSLLIGLLSHRDDFDSFRRILTHEQLDIFKLVFHKKLSCEEAAVRMNIDSARAKELFFQAIREVRRNGVILAQPPQRAAATNTQEFENGKVGRRQKRP